MNTLPVQIFNDISSPRDVIIARAWGAALTLVVIVLIFNLIARAIARRSRVT
jgi:phosphate transport system permease protein